MDEISVTLGWAKDKHENICETPSPQSPETLMANLITVRKKLGLQLRGWTGRKQTEKGLWE